MITTHYTATGAGLPRPLRVALVADLHNYAPRELFDALLSGKPDLVAMPGDFLQDSAHYQESLAFLRAIAGHFPTYCSLGNHEKRAALPDLPRAIEASGAELLSDRYVFRHGMWIGGLDSGWEYGDRQGNTKKTPTPNLAFLDDFAAQTGYRLLLCHHPEYYEPYLRERDIPLILSGHAHGGQWQLFGRGIFAPGQGIFPKYTHGLYEGRLLVSRGLSTSRPYIPRLGNPRELAFLDLFPTLY